MFLAKNRSSLIAATLVALAAATPAFAAQPWFSFRLGDRPDRPVRSSGPDRYHRPQPAVCPPPVVVYGHPQHRPIEYRAVEEAPCDLSFTAYQAGDTIILIARGTNRAAGYCTALTACDTRGSQPVVTLRNTSPNSCTAQVMTPFEVSGSFRAYGCVQTIEVRVAGACHRVCVTQVGRLS